MADHKHIQCADVVPGCPFTAEAESDQELLEKVRAHAKLAHGVDQVSPELAEKVQAAIRSR